MARTAQSVFAEMRQGACDMFGLFKKQSRLEKLQSQYAKLMEEAMQIQRNGDVKGSAAKTAEADALLKDIEELEATHADS